jgi:hypothetical protein
MNKKSLASMFYKIDTLRSGIAVPRGWLAAMSQGMRFALSIIRP